MPKLRDVLIAHQRTDEGCLCGWNVWGESYADHVIKALDDAGYKIVEKSKPTINFDPPKPEIRYVPVPDPRQRY